MTLDNNNDWCHELLSHAVNIIEFNIVWMLYAVHIVICALHFCCFKNGHEVLYQTRVLQLNLQFLIASYMAVYQYWVGTLWFIFLVNCLGVSEYDKTVTDGQLKSSNHNITWVGVFRLVLTTVQLTPVVFHWSYFIYIFIIIVLIILSSHYGGHVYLCVYVTSNLLTFTDVSLPHSNYYTTTFKVRGDIFSQLNLVAGQDF